MAKVACFRSCLLRVVCKRHQHRNIFSINGVWENKLTTSIRKDIEKHWHETIKKSSRIAKNKEDKMYILSMFPYPSGILHMGHIRIYTLSDVLARYYRLLGKNVIHPIGWDAFGLPAENAAIQHGDLPHEWTYKNIHNMKEQLRKLDCSFDWDREIATCDPDYYKWTQYIFLKMYERGLAYQNLGFVNWDPVDKTVLADEQVDENGCSWRSGAKVEKKLLKQWFLKTSKLAESLSTGLDDPSLSGWHDITKMQKNWIGECNGWCFEFKLKYKNEELDFHIPVWTQNPEFLFGVSFIALKQDHYLNAHFKPLEDNSSRKVLEVSAIHPITKATIPLIVSPKFTFQQDQESFLGIPCKNKTHYDTCKVLGLPIIDVVQQTDQKEILKNSQNFSGLDIPTARNDICNLANKCNFGGYKTNIKLRNWLISRQRYWGTPIPIIHCQNCKIVPVPYDQLPVKLPKISAYLESKGMSSPLDQLDDWIQVKCPNCGEPAKRETDTMDTFIDSSWYFLRYLDPRNDKEPFNPKKIASLMPVDIYIGGKEHAILHLFSARFIYHVLHDEGLLPCREPFRRLLMMGMVTNETYKVEKSGRYLTSDEVERRGKLTIEKTTGEKVEKRWEKMSKSKLNGVNPKDVFDEYGVDMMRLFMLSDVPPDETRRWNLSTVKTVWQWQTRMWFLIQDFLKPRTKISIKSETLSQHEQLIFESRNFAIKKVTHILNNTHAINMGIIYLRRLTDNLRKIPREIVGQSEEYEKALGALIVMLAPLAPHFACELWTGFKASPNLLSNKELGDIWDQSWPRMDADYLMDLVVKLNGEDLSVLKMSRPDIEKLDRESAIQQTQSLIEHEMNENTVVKVFFKHFPDFDAEIDYVLRERKSRDGISV